MEQPPIKKGYLYRPQKTGLKKSWVKRWALLYPASETQPPRLETYDSKEAAAKEGTKPSVCLSLSSSSQATPTTQHRSRDFVLDISIEDKVYTYAVDSKEELDTWLQVFEEVARGRSGHKETSGHRSSIVPDLPSFSGDAGEGLQENTLYDSYETMSFNVDIKSTAFSDSLNLYGNFTLQIDSVKLSLLDEHTNNMLYAWPYRYLRRYGRDKTSFSMEAGRKCESGPGLIIFETNDGNDIFKNIQNFVNNISGRHMTPPAQSNQSHGASRDGHHIKPSIPGKPASPGKVGAKPPLVAPRAGIQMDPVSALVTESSLFKQKQKERKGAEEQVDELAGKEPVPWKLKLGKPKGTKERQPTPPEPDPEPKAQPEFEPDPLYSEVQENPNKPTSEPVPPEPEEMYALPEGTELPLRPPMPNVTDLPESSEYDFLNTSGTPSGLYDTTIEEPLGDAWRIYGRTEDNIHTEHYLKGLRIVEDEETSREPEPAKPVVKPTPLRSKPPPKPTPLPKTRPTLRNAKKTKAPDAKKDPVAVPNDPDDQTYDRVGSLPAPSVSVGPSPANDQDTYDHFVRPSIAHPVPAPRKGNISQTSQIDDESELYDHLQRETNKGGTRIAPKTYVPKQKSIDPDEAYDVLRHDDQAFGSSGNLNNLGAGTLPEESQYSEANMPAQPSSLDPSTNDLEENVYDVVAYGET
ncbi:docking protein 2-like [Patiria miniata]|uniref:Uncharacterized protein n=1 Tax=Patiria miniata TaxID=46514 RepID=A0A914B448_PATMI|nr:docking protein 2-like [Patiria miniata]